MILPPIRILHGGIVAARERGFNARHSLGWIKIHCDIPCAGAVLAQEAGEWRFLRLTGLLAAAPFLLAAALSSLLGAVALLIVAWFAFLRVPKLGFVRRQMELRNRLIEVLVAVELYGANYADYLDKEVRQLTSYDLFRVKNWTVAEVRKGVLGHEDAAQAWIKRHRSWIERWVAQLAAEAR